ncbi:double zinc ribbon domain-containing protein [Scatolibacter rhodanostii]|uniref:double zinc ribbon domain-containing protein n=1 Tax=Scatolibacter rhodanostii TaxID=2014781 RepID=UPI000C07170B|nr:zinc ribbon domain-containing protein [Scatolibacter rhodanostii]
MYLAFCDSCGHTEKYGKKEIPSISVARYEEIEKPEYCSQCGTKMSYGCPNCDAPRESVNDKFCKKCGTAYQPK